MESTYRFLGVKLRQLLTIKKSRPGQGRHKITQSPVNVCQSSRNSTQICPVIASQGNQNTGVQ